MPKYRLMIQISINSVMTVQLIVFVCDKSDTSVHMERSSQISHTG